MIVVLIIFLLNNSKVLAIKSIKAINAEINSLRSRPELKNNNLKSLILVKV